MDIELLKQVNRLWGRIYPCLAAEMIEEYGKDSGSVLELGPFSGGVSLELARLCPGLDITVADEPGGALEDLKRWVALSGFGKRIKVRPTALDRLSFDDSEFDLIIVRGAFFFLADRPDLLPEVFRVLRPGGLAIVGGGYGQKTPPEVIDEIAEESRVLNDRLGRKRVSVKELKGAVRKAGLGEHARLVAEGGLWLHIRK